MIERFDIETGERWFYQDGSKPRPLAPEGAQAKRLDQFIQNWTVMIDGGAWIGGWARYWAPRFKQIISIEIDPENYECLVKNTIELGNVFALNACLCEVAGKMRGFEGDKDVTSRIRRALPIGDIPTITIDSLNLSECGFIKLDLQGYDYFALQGAVETIRRCKPVIMFEHDPSCYLRYGVVADDPANLVKSLGMVYLDCLRKDPIWGWR